MCVLPLWWIKMNILGYSQFTLWVNQCHVTGALWWICIPTWDVCNTTTRGQTGHKGHNFSLVSRQPALTWQAVSTKIVVRGLKCYHRISMKMMWSLNTELWHILAVNIMCPCDLDLSPISQKLGHVTWMTCWIYMPIWKFIDVFVFETRPQISYLVAPLLSNRRCHGNHFVPHSLQGGPNVSTRVWSW